MKKVRVRDLPHSIPLRVSVYPDSPAATLVKAERTSHDKRNWSVHVLTDNNVTQRYVVNGQKLVTVYDGSLSPDPCGCTGAGE